MHKLFLEPVRFRTLRAARSTSPALTPARTASIAAIVLPELLCTTSWSPMPGLPRCNMRVISLAYPACIQPISINSNVCSLSRRRLGMGQRGAGAGGDDGFERGRSAPFRRIRYSSSAARSISVMPALGSCDGFGESARVGLRRSPNRRDLAAATSPSDAFPPARRWAEDFAPSSSLLLEFRVCAANVSAIRSMATRFSFFRANQLATAAS